MYYEVVNTSAPEGLIPGTHGFSTVMATKGMPDAFRTQVEGLCSYPHRESARCKEYWTSNPVNWFHLVLPGGAHAAGCTSPADFDYTGRTNRLAHVFFFPQGEMPSGGGARVMVCLQEKLNDRWNGETAWFEPPSREEAVKLRFNAARGKEGRPSTWIETFGARGEEYARRFAALLAKNIDGALAPIYFKAGAQDMDGTRLFNLFYELIDLLPLEKASQATFSTFSACVPGGMTCHLRGIFDANRAFAAASATMPWVDCENNRVVNEELLPPPALLSPPAAREDTRPPNHQTTKQPNYQTTSETGIPPVARGGRVSSCAATINQSATRHSGSGGSYILPAIAGLLLGVIIVGVPIGLFMPKPPAAESDAIGGTGILPVSDDGNGQDARSTYGGGTMGSSRPADHQTTEPPDRQTKNGHDASPTHSATTQSPNRQTDKPDSASGQTLAPEPKDGKQASRKQKKPAKESAGKPAEPSNPEPPKDANALPEHNEIKNFEVVNSWENKLKDKERSFTNSGDIVFYSISNNILNRTESCYKEMYGAWNPSPKPDGNSDWLAVWLPKEKTLYLQCKELRKNLFNNVDKVNLDDLVFGDGQHAEYFRTLAKKKDKMLAYYVAICADKKIYVSREFVLSWLKPDQKEINELDTKIKDRKKTNKNIDNAIKELDEKKNKYREEKKKEQFSDTSIVNLENWENNYRKSTFEVQVKSIDDKDDKEREIKSDLKKKGYSIMANAGNRQGGGQGEEAFQ